MHTLPPYMLNDCVWATLKTLCLNSINFFPCMMIYFQNWIPYWNIIFNLKFWKGWEFQTFKNQMNATTQVQSMTIWWIFLMLYDHQVVYVNWFPMHLQDESCQAIGLPNLVVWLELEVKLTFHHHHHYRWWTLYVLWQWQTWEIVRKIQEMKPCTSSLVLQGLCYEQFAPIHKFSIGQLNIYKW